MTAARRFVLGFLTATTLLAAAGPAKADTSTEERFHDLFVTAGYSTAFGAALGTAFLAFKDEPSEHLQFVAIGASLGFIGGSIMGSYVIFSPMIADTGDEAPGLSRGTLLTDTAIPDHGLVLRPSYNRDTHTVTALEGGMTLARF